MSPYRALTPVPCPCGSSLAYWHGPNPESRVYCCDACWHVMPHNGREWPEDVAARAAQTHSS